MNRIEIASHICDRLSGLQDKLTQEFAAKGRIGTCVVEELLPADIASQIYRALPPPADMVRQSSFRERKYVAVQMDRYNPLLEEALCAFHDQRVIDVVSKITSIKELSPDATLTRGGISAMVKGNFLRTHLDNSHDRNQELYRVLNLLYYVTPHWTSEFGGNLELWDFGVKQQPRKIPALFNRLAVMVTNRSSWHSVDPITGDGSRACISNYYYSPHHADRTDGEYRHVTAFRGRPDEPLKDFFLRADGTVRNGIRKLFKGGIRKPHSYEK